MVIAATTLSIPAFAAHKDGIYNGRIWKANLNIYNRQQRYVATFSVTDTSQNDLSTRNTVNYYDGKSRTFSWWDNGFAVWDATGESGVYIKNASMQYLYKGLSGTLYEVA